MYEIDVRGWMYNDNCLSKVCISKGLFVWTISNVNKGYNHEYMFSYRFIIFVILFVCLQDRILFRMWEVYLTEEVLGFHLSTFD